MATEGDRYLQELRDQRHEQVRQRLGYQAPAPGQLPAKPRAKLGRKPPLGPQGRVASEDESDV